MKHPQKIGSHWSTKKFVHGPRLRQPKEFESIYLSTQAGVRKRKQGIINKSWKLPPSTRLKIGHLKHNKRLAIQSFLTPASKWKYVHVRPYKRKSKIVHGHRRRAMRSSLSRAMIQRDINIQATPYEKKELVRIFEHNPELVGQARGLTIKIIPMKFYKNPKAPGVGSRSGLYEDGRQDGQKTTPVPKKEYMLLNKALFKFTKLKMTGQPGEPVKRLLNMDAEKALRHELDHRRQSYLGPVISTSPRDQGSYEAYRNNPQEIEARAAEDKSARKEKVDEETINYGFRHIMGKRKK